MSKRYLGAIALGVGLTFVPVSVHTGNEAAVPTLAVSDACAVGECCSFSLGDLCLLGDEVMVDHRPGGSGCAQKPGT